MLEISEGTGSCLLGDGGEGEGEGGVGCRKVGRWYRRPPSELCMLASASVPRDHIPAGGTCCEERRLGLAPPAFSYGAPRELWDDDDRL